MVAEWRASTWGEEVSLEYGKAIRGYQEVRGKFRVFGSNGPVGWTDKALAEGPGVILGRKGAYRGVQFWREPFWVIDTAYYVVPKTELDMRWLYYAIKHYKLGEIDDGSPIPSTTRAAVYVRELAVPSPEEQRAISEILGALDDRIDNLRQTNATLQAIAAALFNSWFVDFDGVPPEDMKKSELGLIPRGWRVGAIGEYFDLTMGQSPPGDTYNETGEGIAFYQGRADFGMRFPTERVYCTAPTRLAKKGDVLVSVRAPVGDINVALNDCAIGRGVAAVHHEHASFALYVLHSLQPAFKKFESEGTVFGSINKKQFEALQFVVPPDEVVREFQSIVQPMDARIENNEMQMRTLAKLRDALLPRLISGHLRVSQ